MRKILLIILGILVATAVLIAVSELGNTLSHSAEEYETVTEDVMEVQMDNKPQVRILLIGNSYMNRYRMPETFEQLCIKAGYDVEVAMFAFDGAYLRDFAQLGHVRGILRKGTFDIVVLQEESHVVRTDTKHTAEIVEDLMNEAAPDTRFFLYETMSYRNKPKQQYLFTRAYEDISRCTGSTVIPVGRDFWEYSKKHPGVKMFDDSQHPSVTGYAVVAHSLFNHLGREIASLH